MARGKCTFRQRDVKAALKAALTAAHDAGAEVARCEIDRDGKKIVVGSANRTAKRRITKKGAMSGTKSETTASRAWIYRPARKAPILPAPAGHKKSMPLPGLPWSPDFMAAYDAVMTGEPRPRLAIGASRTKPGTLNEAIVRYYDSAAFQQNSQTYQTRHRQVLDKFRQETGEGNNVPRGDRHLPELTGEQLGKIVGKGASTCSGI